MPSIGDNAASAWDHSPQAQVIAKG